MISTAVPFLDKCNYEVTVNVIDSVMSLFIASQENLELDGLDDETRELWHGNLANLKKAAQ